MGHVEADWYSLVPLDADWCTLVYICNKLKNYGADWCNYRCRLVQFGACRCRLVQFGDVWCSLVHLDVDWSSLVPHVADWCMFHATRCTLA